MTVYGNSSDAARITYKMIQNNTLEPWQMSFSTGKRASTNWASILGTAESAFVSNVINLIEQSTHVSTTYSEWDTAGFVGYHQRLATVANNASNTGGQLPPQIAVVVSLLQTDTSAAPVRRRRGRIYHGMVPSAYNLTTGKMSTTSANGIRDAWKAVGTALQGGAVPLLSSLAGLCVHSRVGDIIMPADKIGVGLAFDTQRRRRQKEAESIAYVNT